MNSDKQPLPVGFKKDGTPQKRSNQFTKRRELNGSVPAKDITEHRAHIAAAKLEACMEGKVQLSDVQMRAAKALMDKGIASRQAIETTAIEPAAALSKDDERALLRALVSQHPDMVQELLGEQARCAGSGQDRAAPRLVQGSENANAA